MKRVIVASSFAALLAVAAVAPPAGAQDTADDMRQCTSGTGTTWAERIDACTRVLDAGPLEQRDHLRVLENRGRLFILVRDYEAALGDYAEMLDIEPQNRDGIAGRGLAQLFLGQAEAALADLDAAVTINSRFAPNFYHRGLAHHALGETDAALADFAEAVTLDPNYEEAFVQRGLVLIEAGRYEEARADFEAALDITPGYAFAYDGLGRLADATGDTPEAIRNYRIAQLLDPNLAAPAERLPELAPATANADGGPLTFVPPAEGLTLEFIAAIAPAVASEDTAVEVGAYLNQLATTDRTLPTDRDAHLWVFGPTEEFRTELEVTRLNTNAAPVARPTIYAAALRPLRSPVESGEGFSYVYRDLELIWGLAIGESASGNGRVMIDCPEDAGAAAQNRGCYPNVPDIRYGTLEWTATFAGWEEVLVPTGRHLTARIEFEIVSETGFDTMVTTVTNIVFWYDPQLGWWVRRQSSDGELVETAELVEIIRPLTK